MKDIIDAYNSIIERGTPIVIHENMLSQEKEFIGICDEYDLENNTILMDKFFTIILDTVGQPPAIITDDVINKLKAKEYEDQIGNTETQVPHYVMAVLHAADLLKNKKIIFDHEASPAFSEFCRLYVDFLRLC